MPSLSRRRSADCSVPVTRREALAAGAAGLAAVASPARHLLAAAEEAPMLPWIDAHSHVWSPDLEKWPLVAGKTKADLAPLSFTDDELLTLAATVKVGRVVLIQHSQFHLWDNAYLVDCAARRPGVFSIVGMVDDRQPKPDEKMRELLPKRVRGFRITPRIHGDRWLEGPGMAAMWQCGGETGQAMCCLIDPAHLPGVEAMCVRHPRTPVVIDHLARIGADGEIREADVKALCGLARHKQTRVKLSAFYALGKKQPPYDDLIPLIRRVLDAFGVERCMWASDSPYQLQGKNTYPASIALVRDRLDFLSDGDREWLLRKTAEQVFFS